MHLAQQTHAPFRAFKSPPMRDWYLDRSRVHRECKGIPKEVLSPSTLYDSLVSQRSRGMHTLVGMEMAWTLSTIEELFHTNISRHTLDPCSFRIPSENEGWRFNVISRSFFERDYERFKMLCLLAIGRTLMLLSSILTWMDQAQVGECSTMKLAKTLPTKYLRAFELL